MCWILLVRKSDTHSIPHDSMSHLRGEFLLSLYNCTLSGWNICMYYLLAGASDHLPLHVLRMWMEWPLYLKWEILFWVWAVTVPSRQVSLPHVCTGCFSSVDLSSCDTVMHWYWVLGAAVVSVQHDSIHRWYPYIQIGISTTSSVLCVYVLVCVPWR